jgi:cation diffusion facilitator family transporter
MDASAAALREREKRWAAASSVVAAVGLTGFKIVVGVATGSLGILAEAAHSGLDLVAALMTLFAVRISGKPADTRHLYGHGKVENLSALFETLLLLLTCAWIIRSAIHRLAAHRLDIEVTLWSFAVMATSILVDASRSRVLYRAARKHHSDALEADALHFRTDIWSSSVVILGLICVKVSEWAPAAGFLRYSDAVAAIAVALIVVLVSVKLGLRTVQSLVDAAPAGADRKIIAAVEALPGVTNCHNVRVRYSGSRPFVDIHVLLEGSQTLREAHALTDRIERAIEQILPEADVTVHPEPRTPSGTP